eukprot:TRINITY_DN6126_c0_g1_i2.p1 TRINITY_DN6126_c0_g1~~TRINITY_DN6126_c0_g1_i2.p1  ORF type:complete len:243 (+),score=-23.96 TRINITY_DN6126_c0_g1_i2:359-1087(+)
MYPMSQCTINIHKHILIMSIVYNHCSQNKICLQKIRKSNKCLDGTHNTHNYGQFRAHVIIFQLLVDYFIRYYARANSLSTKYYYTCTIQQNKQMRLTKKFVLIKLQQKSSKKSNQICRDALPTRDYLKGLILYNFISIHIFNKNDIFTTYMKLNKYNFTSSSNEQDQTQQNFSISFLDHNNQKDGTEEIVKYSYGSYTSRNVYAYSNYRKQLKSIVVLESINIKFCLIRMYQQQQHNTKTTK